MGKYAGAHHVLGRALGEARARRVVEEAWGAGVLRRLRRGHHWRAGVCHRKVASQPSARVCSAAANRFRTLAAAASLRRRCSAGGTALRRDHQQSLVVNAVDVHERARFLA